MPRFDKYIDSWTAIAYSKNPENTLADLAVKIVDQRDVHSRDMETCTGDELKHHQGFIAGIDFVLRLPTQKSGAGTEDIDSEKEESN
jgi:hypothetical protein